MYDIVVIAIIYSYSTNSFHNLCWQNEFFHDISRLPLFLAGGCLIFCTVASFGICFDCNLSFLALRETQQRIRELAHFGGFLDSEYLKRSLMKEFQQMESWYAFSVFSSHLSMICAIELINIHRLEQWIYF